MFGRLLKSFKLEVKYFLSIYFPLPRKTLTKVLSSSPSSVIKASISRSSVAAFTKRTRTVSHSRCEISSSLSFFFIKKNYVTFVSGLMEFFTNIFCDTGCRSMIANFLQINCINCIFITLLSPQPPCRLLVFT